MKAMTNKGWILKQNSFIINLTLYFFLEILLPWSYAWGSAYLGGSGLREEGPPGGITAYWQRAGSAGAVEFAWITWITWQWLDAAGRSGAI